MIDGLGVRCSRCTVIRPLKMFMVEGSFKVFKRCKKCRTVGAQIIRDRNAMGLCRNCGATPDINPYTGRYKWLCDRCEQASKERSRKKRSKLKSEGLCQRSTGCRKRALPGHTMCAEHLQWHSKYTAYHTLKRIEAGRCTRCNTPLPTSCIADACDSCRESINHRRRISSASRAMDALLNIGPIEVPHD